MKPGRKSPADLSVIHTSQVRRITPPDRLSGRAEEVFRELVTSVNAGHFTTSDIPLLASYAEAIALQEEAQKNLDAGVVTDGKVSPWYAILNKQVRLLSILATRLRLTPHSRYDARQAGRNAQSPPSPYDNT